MWTNDHLVQPPARTVLLTTLVTAMAPSPMIINEPHPHIEMGILKPNSRCSAGQSHDDPHLQPKQRKPSGPYVGAQLVPFEEGNLHLPKYQDAHPFRILVASTTY